MARKTCLYCGALLAKEAVDAAARSAAATLRPEPAAPPAARALVVLELSGVDPALVADRLAISVYEARQRAARGGPQLHRVLPPAAAEAEARRLEGLRPRVVPEAELQPALHPVRISGGAYESGVLDLRAADGPLRVAPENVLGLVRGPIAREYAAQEANRRKPLGTARLEAGYRFHIHRHDAPTVELDPWAFTFPQRDVGRSTLLTLSEWTLAVCRDRPQDDAFRHEPPALSPSEEASDEARRGLGGRARPGDAPAILDNLRQFRFYSAWRAALLRRGL